LFLAGNCEIDYLKIVPVFLISINKMSPIGLFFNN
jgi:hypothetical protein